MVWPFSKQSPADFLPITPDPNIGKQQDQAPQYVSVEQFNSALGEIKTMSQRFEDFSGLVQSAFTGGQLNAAPRVQPRAADTEPAIVDLTDDEYNDALLRGDAAKIGIRTNAIVERRLREERHASNARFERLESQGMAILDQVQNEVGQTSLARMPYYTIVKSDVDRMLEALPTHQRTPQMREHCYNAVVGANVEKIMTFRQTEDQRIAQEREAATSMPGRTKERDEGPTPDTVFGTTVRPDATWTGSGKLWGHKTPDEWAKNRYGVENMQQAAVYASNVMAIDDCQQCFSPIVGGKCHCKRVA